MRKLFLAILFGIFIATGPALAARCGGDFNSFVAGISAEAQAAGVSPGVTSAAFGGVSQDMAVLNFDRRQRYTFNKSFEQYVSTRVGSGRINGGRAMLQRHAALLSRIEQRFGVPRQILVAIWGLETDFGKGDMGKLPVVRTLTTLAHDCRRSELFQGELLAALKIVQRGDLPLRDLIGAYAGEIGQTNFCRRPISNTASISTATAASTCATRCPTCSPPPPISCTPTASRWARPTAKAPPISRRCANGITPRSIARRSGILPISWEGSEGSVIGRKPGRVPINRD
jgi:Transglycosylase SLT domain